MDDDDCDHCGGEGWVFSCIDDMCVNAEDGCEYCQLRCEHCNPSPSE